MSATCEHDMGTAWSGRGLCGRPIKAVVTAPWFPLPKFVCGIHARYWARVPEATVTPA